MIQNNQGAMQLALANPVGTFASGLLDLDFDLQRISDSNRLMFSLLANDGFRNWAISYQNTIIQQAQSSGNYILDRAQITQDVVNAMVTNADNNILFSLSSFNDPLIGNTVEQPAGDSIGDQGLWIALNINFLKLHHASSSLREY